MRIKNTIILLALPLATIFSNCTGSTQDISKSVEASPSVSARNTAPSTTNTSLPTNIPTQTLTPTMISTLSVEDARTKLLELLNDNGDCRLPCLWGIAPGKSSFEEAREILTPLSSLSPSVRLSPSHPGAISPSYNENQLQIYNSLRFLTYPGDEIISYITFHTEARKITPEGYEYVFDTEFFNKRISAYMPPSILSEQGIPANVLISALATAPTRGGQFGFDVVILYPNQGILVHYSMPWLRDGINVKGCLSNAHVEMELYPSGKGDSFFELLTPTLWPKLIQNNYKPLEEVTSMTIQEFYNTFRQSTDKCIETPAKLWPTPEP